MKKSNKTSLRTDRLPSRMLSKLIASALCLTAASSFAATEQWLGVPGTSATTNWTDAANWTASVQSTYYNQVQFTGTGASANTDFSINNVLDATTGVAQMPIWRLDMFPLNGNYTTLINPGVTLTLGAGYGDLIVGADAQNTGSPAPANAFETITFTGAGGALSMGGSLTVGQGSTTANDTHNVTLNLSGLDNFTMDASSGGTRGLYVASDSFQRGNGTVYFAKTNSISITDTLRIANLNNTSNSQPSGIYLGSVNNLRLGGDLIIGGFGASAGGFMKFNPAVVGGPVAPTVALSGPGGNSRIAHLTIGNGSGGVQSVSFGTLDLSGGAVSIQADVLQLGMASTANAMGTLTFSNGTANVNNATVGNQTAGSGGTGVGVINVNNGGTLQVNQTLTLATVAGTLTPGSAGTVNLNGGNLTANNIVSGGGASTIAANNGNVTVGNTASFNNLNLTNSALSLTLASGVTNVTVASLTTGGATNVINILAAPPYASYPIQIPLVKYSSLNGAGFNIGVGSLPALYAGHLVNNTANGSIDIVFTSGATKLVWNGNINNNWDTTTANWLAGSAAVYANGQLVQFFDGAASSTVNLTTTLLPSSLIVSNSSQKFTFNGTGALSGLTGLSKSGSGTLIIDNSGSNDFSGGVTINGGTVQIGNNDANGNLPAGNVVDNGTLAIARSDSQTLNNTVSGSGSLAQSGGTLLLSGNNTYTGNTLVTNNGTLILNNGSALGGGSGSTVIANGSTLDINGNYQNKPLVISGTGVSGTGALINSGGGVYGFASQITLAGDTTFGYAGRCDLVNATIGTGGNPYNLTINTPSAYFEWQNVSADAALASVNFVAGSWGWKNLTPTSFGNPAGTLTLGANSTVTIWNPSIINKNVDVQGGLLVSYSGGNVMSGGMILEDGFDTFQMNGGCSLTLSNTISGSVNSTLYVSGGDGTLTLAGNSPSFLGNVYLNRGVVVLDGSIGGTVNTHPNTTFAGHGSASGLVDVNSTFYPGNSGVVGTFTAGGGLTLEGGAALTMDLSSSTASGNDTIQVNGDLTMNGNNISINPINGTLANGTYNLISYTGNFNGSIGTAATAYATAYTLTLTNNTTTKQIQVIVSGTLTPSLLYWNNFNGSGQWDIGSSLTWSNATTHSVSSGFFALDSVTLDDSILSAVTPVTNINVTTTVVPATITNNSTVNYTLSGSGSISGSGSLVKLGSSTLGIGVSDTSTGPVTVGGGTLQTVANNTLLSATSITVANGATFDFAGHGRNSTNPIVITGNGVNGHGAVYNSTGGIYGELLNIVMAADATIGQFGQGRYDLAPGSQISGAHNLTINWNGDYGEIDNINVGSTVQGITFTNGSLGLKHLLTAFQSPATVFTFSPNTDVTLWDDGGANGLNSSLHLMANSKFELQNVSSPVFNGNNVTIDDSAVLQSFYNSGANVTFNSAVTLNGIAHFILGDHNYVFTNVVSGSGGFLAEYYNSALVFSASNTYTGPSIINQGGNSFYVMLTGNGSISHSSLVFFGGSDLNALRMDVTGRADQTFTLATGQTLAGIGKINGKLTVASGATVSPAGTNTTIGVTAGSNATGAINATGDVALNGTTIIKLNGSGVNDVIQSGGNITYGGTLNLANISATPLANGNSFQVFKATGTYSGSFASIVPATPGAGLAWDLSQLNSGFVNVVASGGSGPIINNTTVANGQLIFSGSGGTAGSNYAVLTATNLANPQWVPVATNTFGTGGTFSVTNTISGSTPQLFYRIQLQ